MTLNSDQQKAVDGIREIFERVSETEEKLVIGLQGEGGTGKTYTAKYLIGALGAKTIGLTPTNEARRLLGQSLGVSCRTLSSFLKKLPEYDDSGFMRFDFGTLDKNPIDGYQIILVDESSMVGEADSELLISLYRESTAKLLILMYDKYQHYPVGESFSTLIEAVDIEFTLAIQERQKPSSPIYPIIQEAREAVIENVENYDPRWTFRSKLNKANEYCVEQFDENSNSTYIYTKREIALSRIADLFVTSYETGDFYSVRCIAFRNETINTLNQEIRDRLVYERGLVTPSDSDYGMDFFQGELIICRKPVTDKEFSTMLGKEITVTKIDTSAACLILRISPPVSISFTYPQYSQKTSEIKFVNAEYSFHTTLVKSLGTNAIVEINLPTLKSKKSWVSDIEKLRKTCESYARDTKDKVFWKKYYYPLLKLFHDFGHGYAVNTHQSQGNSFGTVYVDCNDIASIPSQSAVQRGFYVALSRAKQNILLSSD